MIPAKERIEAVCKEWLEGEGIEAKKVIRRFAWLNLLAPCYGELPSTRLDIDILAVACSQRGTSLRRELCELLRALPARPEEIVPTNWTKQKDADWLSQVRLKLSSLDAKCWIAICPFDPNRRYLRRRRLVHAAGLELAVRRGAKRLELRAGSVSEVALGVEGDVELGPNLGVSQGDKVSLAFTLNGKTFKNIRGCVVGERTLRAVLFDAPPVHLVKEIRKLPFVSE